MRIFGPPNIEKMKAKQDVKGLIKALHYKKNSQIRFDAARLLGEISDLRAVDPLIDALEDEEVMVRNEAARVLGEIGDPRAVDPLINALDSEEDYSIGVRWGVIEALGKLGDTRVVELLIALLRNKGADINAENAYTEKSLCIAKANDHKGIVEILKRLGVKSLDDTKGGTT
jgi:HEAT repeat protein